MKQSFVLFIIFFSVLQNSVLIARQVFPGEMLWNMTQLVTEASFDKTITQDDIPLIITEAGTTWKLAESITYATTGTAVRIAADNVVFNLNGHTIDGLSSGEWGIGINGNSNIIIRNGFVKDFIASPIFIENTEQLWTQNIIADGGGLENFIVFNSTGVRIEHCDSINTSTGFVLFESSDCILSDCLAQQSGIGFLLSRASHNCLINCVSDLNFGGFFITPDPCSGCAGGCNNSRLINCVARSNTNDGFFIDRSDNIILKGCTAHLNAQGYQNTLSNGVLFDSCTASLNTQDGFQQLSISPAKSGNMYLNSVSRGNGRYGFYIHGAVDGVLKNCIALDNTTYGIIIEDPIAGSTQFIVESCIVQGSTIGINNISTGSVTFNNLALANTTDFVGVSPVETVPTTTTGFWANVSQS